MRSLTIFFFYFDLCRIAILRVNVPHFTRQYVGNKYYLPMDDNYCIVLLPSRSVLHISFSLSNYSFLDRWVKWSESDS